MARTQAIEKFYEVKFNAPIRGYHIYKETWTPRKNQLLHCFKDNREVALQHDEYSIGIYDDLNLVGHAPKEISKLLHQFLDADRKNKVVVNVSGKKRKELGLVIPGIYRVISGDKKHAQIMKDNLMNIDCVGIVDDCINHAFYVF